MSDMKAPRKNPSMFAIITEMYKNFELEDFTSATPVTYEAFVEQKGYTQRYNLPGFNIQWQKDYFFFVFNKQNVTNGKPAFVVNSILGIPKRTANMVNFEQIKWNSSLNYRFGTDMMELMSRNQVSDRSQFDVLEHWTTEYLVRLQFAEFLKRYTKVDSFTKRWIELLDDAGRRINS